MTVWVRVPLRLREKSRAATGMETEEGLVEVRKLESPE